MGFETELNISSKISLLGIIYMVFKIYIDFKLYWSITKKKVSKNQPLP